MTLSSNQIAPSGLDAMLIVYSLLDDHPASAVCESFIRERTRWVTTTLALFEVSEEFWSQTGGGSHLP